MYLVFIFGICGDRAYAHVLVCVCVCVCVGGGGVLFVCARAT